MWFKRKTKGDKEQDLQSDLIKLRMLILKKQVMNLICLKKN
jgi:hypothetical protein